MSQIFACPLAERICRPPAPSKAAVAGTGRSSQGITMDFIVVPGEP